MGCERQRHASLTRAGATKTKDMEIEKENQQQSGSGLESSSCSPDYVPFGDDWRAFVMKVRKADMVEMLRKSLMRGRLLEDELTNIAAATPTKWGVEFYEFCEEFPKWAQNRSRHAIAKAND